MPQWEITFRSRLRGPISSGAIHRHVAEYEEDVAQTLAEEGENLVLAALGTSLRHPTGYYESRITSRAIGHNAYEVHDSGVVYGPWLEGTGSRNPVTIFPGYHSFQRAGAILRLKRGGIARRILAQHRARGHLI